MRSTASVNPARTVELHGRHDGVCLENLVGRDTSRKINAAVTLKSAASKTSRSSFFAEPSTRRPASSRFFRLPSLSAWLQPPVFSRPRSISRAFAGGGIRHDFPNGCWLQRCVGLRATSPSFSACFARHSPLPRRWRGLLGFGRLLHRFAQLAGSFLSQFALPRRASASKLRLLDWPPQCLVADAEFLLFESVRAWRCKRGHRLRFFRGFERTPSP